MDKDWSEKDCASRNSELVLVAKSSGGITTVTLNDPQSKNAMSEQMATRFAEVMNQLGSDKELRVVVLTGAGGAFSGGGHLEMLFDKTKLERKENQSRMEIFYDQFLSVRKLAVPVIAAIGGHAVGAGLCLAMACDIRIAVTTAKLGLNFVNLGLHPGMGATYFLPRLVGPARAAELLYSGSIISADKGLSFGLINTLVEPENFEAAVRSAAENISLAGPQAVRALKQSLLLSEVATLESALKREASCQAEDYAGSQFLEGITAAREKRRPVF